MKSAEEVERNARIVQEIESHIEGMEDVRTGVLHGRSFLPPKLAPFLLFLGHPRLGHLFSPPGHAFPIITWLWWALGGLEKGWRAYSEPGGCRGRDNAHEGPPRRGSPLTSLLVPTAPGPAP